MENAERCICSFAFVCLARLLVHYLTDICSAIVTIFQIEDAGNDPTTRTAAFLSMTAALFSLGASMFI